MGIKWFFCLVLIFQTFWTCMQYGCSYRLYLVMSKYKYSYHVQLTFLNVRRDSFCFLRYLQPDQNLHWRFWARWGNLTRRGYIFQGFLWPQEKDCYLVDLNNIKGWMNELLEYQVRIDLLWKGSQMIIVHQNLRHLFHIHMDLKS